MRYPLQTLLLVGGTVLAFFVPSLTSFLIYDRFAIVEGEWWRLLTGSLVHFSGSHLVYNLPALVIAGAVIESRGYRGFVWVCLAASTTIGLVLFVAVPQMHYFGGLSGIATGAIVYLCLHMATETDRGRMLGLLILVLVASKMALEFASGGSLVGYVEPPPFVPAPLSHAAGAVAALLVFLLGRKRLRRADKPEQPKGASVDSLLC